MQTLGIRDVDAQFGVSATLKAWSDSLQTKAVELGESYHVNEKTQVASQILGNIGRSLGDTIEVPEDLLILFNLMPSDQTINY